MRLLLALLSLLASTAVIAATSFTEEFDEGWENRWVTATDPKYKGRFVVDSFAPDVALKIPEKAKHYGMTAAMETPLEMSEGVVLQFEARYSASQSCSGAYMKFYSHDADFKMEELQEDTPYTIMFGPDVCGSTSKVHLILRHKSPKTGKIEEKHLKNPPRVKTDKKTHVYTAVLNADNTFELMVDGVVADEGSLFEKLTPPIIPPEEIPDPEDKKPEDWVDEAKIDDPDAVKPEDWVEEEFIDDPEATKPEGWLDDEPLEIADPDAEKPEDWDEEEDGAWTAPTIKNPTCVAAPGCGEWKRPQIKNSEYSGPWKPPKIDNPAYKGEWKQKMIENPEYYEDKTPLESLAAIGSIGFELWTMDEEIYFDNIVVTHDKALAESFREKWTARSAIEKEAEEAKREKERAETEKSQAPSAMRQLLEHPIVAPVAPYLEPVVSFCEAQGQGFWSFLMIIGSLTVMTLLRRCCRRRPAVDEAAQRKKDDAPQPDDPASESPAGGESSSAGDPNPKDRSEDEDRDPPKQPKSRRSN